jgi:hypothetical protein
MKTSFSPLSSVLLPHGSGDGVALAMALPTVELIGGYALDCCSRPSEMRKHVRTSSENQHRAIPTASARSPPGSPAWVPAAGSASGWP